MAKECLKMFFMKPPPHNQFLCRAYLCEAQLLAPPNADSPVSSLSDTNSQGSFLGPSENAVLVNSIPDSPFTAFESGSLLWYNTVNLYIIGLLLLKKLMCLQLLLRCFHLNLYKLINLLVFIEC